MKIQVEWNMDFTHRDLSLIRDDNNIAGLNSCLTHHKKDGTVIYLFIYLFCFKQYLVRGAQFSEAGLNGTQMKRKNNTKDNNK